MDKARADTNTKKRALPPLEFDPEGSHTLASLEAPVSPPQKKRHVEHDHEDLRDLELEAKTVHGQLQNQSDPRLIKSPFQLLHVQGLPDSDNVDAVKLTDILGDPLIKECWGFNFLWDVDFFMNCFDEDVRELVDVYVVHGSWRREDTNRARIEEAVSRWKRVKQTIAYMPEAFGTHHSKMLVLIRHDDQAQVVILTANFIPQDLRMCQAVWRSPLLPLHGEVEETYKSRPRQIGKRFKFDFLSYLKSYGKKLQDLVVKMEMYDFAAVKAAFIASVPSRQNYRLTDPDEETLWGWPGLKVALKDITMSSTEPHIVVQVSSVATLGVADTWLRGTLFRTLSSHAGSASTPKSTFSVVFPTPDDIRQTIDGYSCGGSIHMKTESPQQVKQLKYLKPLLCRWGGSNGDPVNRPGPSLNIRRAGRGRAGPHIKTYLRFTNSSCTKLDYAMVTSSNLSKQAWGAEATSNGEVRISSYEVGVVVWPGLWKESESDEVAMIPIFKQDTLDSEQDTPDRVDTGVKALDGNKMVVGLRIPYDLPLVRYSDRDAPWCASKVYTEPDWKGFSWPGF